MASNTLTEFIQSEAIVDPQTGRLTTNGAQRLNAIVRAARAALVPATDDGGNIGLATETNPGIVEKATKAEVYAATADKYVAADLIETASAPPSALVAADGTLPVDWDAFVYDEVTVDDDTEIANPTNGQPGTWRTLLVAGDDGTSRTITFGDQFGGTPPTITDCTDTQKYLIGIFCKAADQFIATAIDGTDAGA
jgi:hypothetical protein